MTQIRGLRWWIVALISLGTIINYLSRNALGVLAPTLKGEMGISTEQYSYIVGAFQIGYTIMQPVCGLIVDAIGLQLGFAMFAALWSIAGCLQGGVTGWVSLAGARGLMGLTEAAAIPAGMKAVAEWFPDKEKSIAVGFFNVGTSFGALLAPPLVAAVTLTSGWRAAFVVTGAIGFFWAALWYAFYRSPSQHALLSPGERAEILSGQTHPDGSAPKPSARELLATRRFWAIAVPRFFAEPAWQTFSFWIPLYLATERHMDLRQIALFAWLPFLAADFGGVFGGFVSPFLMKYFWRHAAVVAHLGRRPGRGDDDRARQHRPGLFALHGDRTVLHWRFRPPDDLGAGQYAVRRSLRFARGRRGQRLCRDGGLDRRAWDFLCSSARWPTRWATVRCSDCSASSISSERRR